MRLLQLPTGRDQLLDLHPNMTVVQGLDPDSHRRLVDAVIGLAHRVGGADGGLLEAHGVLFELRSDLLELLDHEGDDPDPVVHAGDLPTQPLTVDARELRTREQDFNQLLGRIAAQAERQSQARGAVAAAAVAVDEARRAFADADAGTARRAEEMEALRRRIDELAERRRPLAALLAELQPARDATAAHRRDVEDRTAAVRDAARSAAARQAAMEDERDALAADRNPDAVAALDRTQADLHELIAVIEAERADAGDAPVAAPVVVPDAEAVSVRLEGVDARLDELDRVLAAIAPIDPGDVIEAMALVRGDAASGLVPSPQALALADDLDAIERVVGDEGLAGSVTEGSLAEARERLDDARQALLEAEQAVRNPVLDRDEVDRLEAAHELLLNAIDKADGRFGGNRARERVIALREAEQAVLDRMGFASYAHYMIGTSLLDVDPEKEALDAARAALAAAEDEWRDLERVTDATLARAEVLDRRRGLVEQARALVGAHVPVTDLALALRDLRVPAASDEDSAARLRIALERAGLEVGDEDLDLVELTMTADAWLSEVSSADQRRQAAEEERTALEGERWVLRAEAAAIDEIETGRAPEPDAESVREARLTDARARLEEAENRWLAHEMAEERWAELAPILEEATAMARAAAEAAAAAEAELAEAIAELAEVLEREHPLQVEVDAVAEEEAEARARLEALTTDVSLEPETLIAAIESTERQQREAEDALETESRALALLDAEGQAAAVEIERLQDIVAAQGSGTATEAEELEWYLLARLAAQRSVSVAGSLPLLLDDALRGLDESGVDHLLTSLERMAEAVQVIVISEDPVVASWAQGAGPARAAVVRPGVS
jgi:hypothetical protein